MIHNFKLEMVVVNGTFFSAIIKVTVIEGGSEKATVGITNEPMHIFYMKYIHHEDRLHISRKKVQNLQQQLYAGE